MKYVEIDGLKAVELIKNGKISENEIFVQDPSTKELTSLIKKTIGFYSIWLSVRFFGRRNR